MNKIVNFEKAIQISEQLRREGKSIVLAGGVFDILHVGHIRFLEEAKKLGDFLFILLENDEAIKLTKGDNRPFNIQQDRAEILAELTSPDYIICLPKLTKDIDYDRIVISIKPAIIAATENDPAKIHKQRQAQKINAKYIEVIRRMSGFSTSKLAKLLEKNTL